MAHASGSTSTTALSSSPRRCKSHGDGAGPAGAASGRHPLEGEAEVAPGTSDVEIKATDLSGNERTYTYRVNRSGSAKTLTYDANGNLLSDGVRTLEWDALDQLIAVSQGTHRSEFSYDGEGRRVRIVEKENGTVTEDRRFLWCGTAICEERDAGGSTLIITSAKLSGNGYLLVVARRN